LRIQPEKDSAAIVSERTAFKVLVVVDSNIRFVQTFEPIIVGDRRAADEIWLALATVDVV
jgi:hypothetical protein